MRRGQRLLQAALRAGFESLHERLRVVRLYAVRLRLRLGAARLVFFLQRRALRRPTSLGAHVFAIQRRSRRPHLRHRLFVLGHVRHELFELILLGVEVLDERREGAIAARAVLPSARRASAALASAAAASAFAPDAAERRPSGPSGDAARIAPGDPEPATGWNRAACAADSRRCTSNRSGATSRSFSLNAPDAPWSCCTRA